MIATIFSSFDNKHTKCSNNMWYITVLFKCPVFRSMSLNLGQGPVWGLSALKGITKTSLEKHQSESRYSIYIMSTNRNIKWMNGMIKQYILFIMLFSSLRTKWILKKNWSHGHMFSFYIHNFFSCKVWLMTSTTTKRSLVTLDWRRKCAVLGFSTPLTVYHFVNMNNCQNCVRCKQKDPVR